MITGYLDVDPAYPNSIISWVVVAVVGGDSSGGGGNSSMRSGSSGSSSSSRPSSSRQLGNWTIPKTTLAQRNSPGYHQYNKLENVITVHSLSEDKWQAVAVSS